MKRLAIASLVPLLLCASCASGGSTGNDLKNYQVIKLAQKSLDESVQSKILIVYSVGDFLQKERHSFCIMKTATGHLYAYDKDGSQEISGDWANPREVAKQLEVNVIDAFYETN